jgi:uncharacterized protein (TIGR02246 family)
MNMYSTLIPLGYEQQLRANAQAYRASDRIVLHDRAILIVSRAYRFSKGHSLANTSFDIAISLQQRWQAAFNARDIAAIVALYSEDACLFGGKPDLSVGRPAIQAYFNALPPVRLQAEFGEQTIVQLTPSVIMSAGFITFARITDPPTKPVPFRITLTIVDIGGAWQIASHHASQVT